ncbi:glycosyltransferase [Ammoniphilus sp. CFH 90114]|uniref:glycosyltransferase n=1 Tax=Ammoniphilus sp. CFH 90114 TaxID=2493665 RepID=UPI001F0BCB7D|nr:glycosyltransferase [Ammoniphilus sp. CFH 90114]
MWVIWLLAIYGLSTILVHLFVRWNEYFVQGEDELRVHLLLYNSEKCLEGSIRSLVHLSRLKGQPLQLIVYDFGSTDNTVKMLETLQKENPFLFDQVEILNRGPFHLVSMEEEQSQARLTIDLRQGLRRGTIQPT